jgi:hypothetical protein
LLMQIAIHTIHVAEKISITCACMACVIDEP